MSENAPETAAIVDSGRPPRRRRAIILGALSMLVVAAVVAVVILMQPATSSPQPPKALALDTATVTRGDLLEQVRLQGTLTYASSREIGTSLTGTVTALPTVGGIISAGQQLFRINDSPVVLLHGDLPAWRSFETGMTKGADVLQLERNLAKLGFFSRTPDTEFSRATALAISAWQKSIGIEQTGTIEPGRVIFSPGDVRVHSATARIGDGSGAEILSVTSATQEVQAFIGTNQQSIAQPGATVTILLPGGVEAPATVVSAGTPVEQEGTTGKSLKIPLTIALDDPAVASGIDTATVTVLLTEVRGTDLLLVPVVALLAQPGGGFGVEVVTGDPSKDTGTDGAAKTPSTSLVTVELGAFANGLVSVTGGDLDEGDVVVVAQ